MFGIDSPELLVIAVVALLVIGPKELPKMLRSWGKWMSQMRGMASEFRGHVDEMVRQSELDEVKKQLESAPGLDLQSLDPTREIKAAIHEGMAEGEKALAEAKAQIASAPATTADNPLVEPESAPQLGVEPADSTTVNAAPAAVAEPTPAVPQAPSAAAETPLASPEKPAKAVAAG